MSYVSLYRRYRPQTFADVVGQRHVIETLRNAIREDRLHHAYLLAGPRGTGKTTIARILAMAVNATGGPTPDPDPDDPVAVAIRAGSAVDVVELDMASHGGVDDARDLRERARFAPASLRRKVYILDEVHMASPAAFNALLKLIEEPPEHVMFAMATTDPQKVIPTILSRVQRLDLRRVPGPAVAEHVRRIVELEGATIEEGAVQAVVRAGDGSVRDTLSVLEQVLAFAGRDVTDAAVAEALGLTPVERCFDAIEHVAAGDLTGVFVLTQQLLDDGHALRRFALDLVRHVRDLLVLQVAPDHADLVAGTEGHRARLAEQAARVPRDSLLRAMDLLSATLVEMREGPPRLPLELALAKLASPSLAPDLSSLVDRVARLEQARSVPTAAPAAAPTERAATRPDAAGTVPSGGGPPTVAARGDALDDVAAAVRPAVVPPATPDPAAATAPPAVPAPTGAGPEPGDGDGDGDVDRDGGGGDDGRGDAGDGQLATVVANWDRILDLLKRTSRKVHAVYLPGRPHSVNNAELTLEYGERHARFHAQEAPKSSYVQALRDAMREAVGFELGVRTRVSGDGPLRPRPPDVTRDRDPVTNDPATNDPGTRDPAAGGGHPPPDPPGDATPAGVPAAAAGSPSVDGGAPLAVAVAGDDAPPTPPPPDAPQDGADEVDLGGPEPPLAPVRPVDEVDDVRQAEADAAAGAARAPTLDEVDLLLQRELQAVEVDD